MSKLLNFLKKIEPDKKKSPFMHTVYDGLFTFAFTPDEVTKDGVHIRDGIDLKRTMVFVVLALSFCYIFGAFNVGHQHYKALGLFINPMDSLGLKLGYGLLTILPIFVVSMIVGLGVEFYYASKRGHPIQEGYLVSGALIPLIMPPDISLWILTVAIIFAVIIGKEAFGGTGMNIFNVALLARVFIFFAYPTTISGDYVWVSGIVDNTSSLSWLHELFGVFGESGKAVVDSFTGATPLALAKEGGWNAITQVYTSSEMFWGFIPGSIGETSKIAVLIGAGFLLITGIASWRIMLSMVLGTIFAGLIMNSIGGPGTYSAIPFYYQLIMGSFLFAMAFMATDPVTASGTNKGKWIYGFLIGMIGMIVRVWNPAYPEGWMLAILFMNIFSPLIDHFIIEGNIKKRLNRGA